MFPGPSARASRKAIAASGGSPDKVADMAMPQASAGKGKACSPEADSLERTGMPASVAPSRDSTVDPVARRGTVADTGKASEGTAASWPPAAPGAALGSGPRAVAVATRQAAARGSPASVPAVCLEEVRLAEAELSPEALSLRALVRVAYIAAAVRQVVEVQCRPAAEPEAGLPRVGLSALSAVAVPHRRPSLPRARAAQRAEGLRSARKSVFQPRSLPRNGGKSSPPWYPFKRMGNSRGVIIGQLEQRCS